MLEEKKKEGMAQKNIWRNNGWMFIKFDPRNLTKPRKRNKKYYAKVHHNETATKQIWKENLKINNRRIKDILLT